MVAFRQFVPALLEYDFLRVFSRKSVPSPLMKERTIVLLVSDRICSQMWDYEGNYISLLSNIVQLLSTENHSSTCFFSLFLTLGYCSSFHNFVPGSEISRPRCLINMTSYWCLQSGRARLFVVSIFSCSKKKQIQSESEQNPVTLTFFLNPPRPFL